MVHSIPEAVKASYDRQNVILSTVYILVNLFQFIILPVIALPEHPGWLLLLVPLVFISQPLWYMAHESFHSGLHSNRRVNDAVGRVLAVMHGAPWGMARLGHLMHHRFNRAPIDAPEVYDPRVEGYASAALRYYPRLFGGLYLGEVLSYAVFLLPTDRLRQGIAYVLKGDDTATVEMRKAALTQLTTPDTVRAARIEAIAFGVIIGVSMLLYRNWWWVVPLMLLARGLIISLADNLPHYGTPLTAPKFARNMMLPQWLSRAILHFNYHRIHHGTPTLPWQELPSALAQQGEVLETPYFKAALAQLRGPIALADMPSEPPRLH